MNIYCCNCKKYIKARLTKGKEIYPHREDLKFIPFWKCDTCKGYVGCHYKTNTPTAPLGCIPSPEIKEYRTKIHTVIDPFWRKCKGKTKNKMRTYIYKDISDFLGYEFHSAKIRDLAVAMKIFNYVNQRKVQDKWQKKLNEM